MKEIPLSPIPRPKHRKQSVAPASPSSGETSVPATPDVSYLAEALRPLAVPIAEIQFDPANARMHDDANLDAIRGSLATYAAAFQLASRPSFLCICWTKSGRSSKLVDQTAILRGIRSSRRQRRGSSRCRVVR
jgi:hypothetical protein